MIIGGTVNQVFRISKGRDVIDSVEALPVFARDDHPGRHHADEHSLDSFPGSNVTARS